MKILNVTAQKPNSTGSGVYLAELVKGFDRLGCEQAVIAGIYETDEVELPKEVPFYPLHFKTAKLPFAIPGMSDEMPYESSLYGEMTMEMQLQFQEAYVGHIWCVVKGWRPDVIVCHHLYFLTASVREAFPDIKVVGICHGTGIRQMQKNSMQREYIKKQIKHLDMVFALHEEQKSAIIKTYGVPEEKVKVVGVGYNSDIFHNVDAKKEPYPIRLLYAGKLSQKKGVMSLLKSLAHLSIEKEGLILSLAGGYGNEKEYKEICKLAEESVYQVHILGRKSQNELAKEMRKSHIFVLPSFYEGLPLVLLEAMACGDKVICTDLPGIAPWMDAHVPGNGIRYVKAPMMQNTDEPVEEALPAFEENLAEVINTCVEDKKTVCVNPQSLSWSVICERIVESL